MEVLMIYFHPFIVIIQQNGYLYCVMAEIN